MAKTIESGVVLGTVAKRTWRRYGEYTTIESYNWSTRPPKLVQSPGWLCPLCYRQIPLSENRNVCPSNYHAPVLHPNQRPKKRNRKVNSFMSVQIPVAKKTKRR